MDDGDDGDPRLAIAALRMALDTKNQEVKRLIHTQDQMLSNLNMALSGNQDNIEQLGTCKEKLQSCTESADELKEQFDDCKKQTGRLAECDNSVRDAIDQIKRNSNMLMRLASGPGSSKTTLSLIMGYVNHWMRTAGFVNMDANRNQDFLKLALEEQADVIDKILTSRGPVLEAKGSQTHEQATIPFKNIRRPPTIISAPE